MVRTLHFSKGHYAIRYKFVDGIWNGQFLLFLNTQRSYEELFPSSHINIAPADQPALVGEVENLTYPLWSPSQRKRVVSTPAQRTTTPRSKPPSGAVPPASAAVTPPPQEDRNDANSVPHTLGSSQVGNIDFSHLLLNARRSVADLASASNESAQAAASAASVQGAASRSSARPSPRAPVVNDSTRSRTARAVETSSTPIDQFMRAAIEAAANARLPLNSNSPSPSTSVSQSSNPSAALLSAGQKRVHWSSGSTQDPLASSTVVVPSSQPLESNSMALSSQESFVPSSQDSAPLGTPPPTLGISEHSIPSDLHGEDAPMEGIDR